MRKALIAAAAIPVALSLLVPPSASAVDYVNTKKIRNAVTVNGILAHERVLQRIANQNGGTRASGTPGYDASARYVANTLKKAGYKVRVQEFTFPFFRTLEDGVLTQTSPTATDYETSTFTYSGSGDVTGAIVATNDIVVPAGPEPSTSSSGCEAADFAPAPAGPAIALVQRGTCAFAVKVDNAVAAGYDAVIIFNEGTPGFPDRIELLDGVTLGTPRNVPVLGLSYEDGAALYAAAQAGPVTVRAFTSVEVNLAAKTSNVIADSPKGKKANEVVLVGSHLDSIVEGAGSNDNGSGAAMTLEIAQEMAKLKSFKKMQRKVRFAFWGAEEANLLGAEYYVERLTDAQLSNIYANLNFDMVGSRNYVRFVYNGDGSEGEAGPPGSAAIEKIFTDYFTSQGLASAPTPFDGRSDYGPFIAAGVPAGGLFSGAEGVKTEEEAAIYGGTAGEPYDPCYHQACDDINNLSTKALSEMGDAAAHAVWTLAKSKSGIQVDSSRVAQKSAKKVQLAQQGPLQAR